MKKVLIIGVIVLVLLAVGGFWLISQDQDSSAPETSTPASSTSPDANDTTGQPASDSFTSAEVAAHNTEADCWSIINDNVYDLTSYIPRHPGGDEILRACGVDGTSLFTSRTTESGEAVGTGTGHSSSAQSQLESLKVGTLAN